MPVIYSLPLIMCMCGGEVGNGGWGWGAFTIPTLQTKYGEQVDKCHQSSCDAVTVSLCLVTIPTLQTKYGEQVDKCHQSSCDAVTVSLCLVTIPTLQTKYGEQVDRCQQSSCDAVTMFHSAWLQYQHYRQNMGSS